VNKPDRPDSRRDRADVRLRDRVVAAQHDRDRAGVHDLAGADVVEVIPTAVGSADVTALVAERAVRELLTGIALRRGQDAP